VIETEHRRHQARIVFGYGYDPRDAAADMPLKLEHPLGLESKVRLPQGVRGILCVPLPDHGLNNVLEKHARAEILKIGCGREEIANHAIELLRPHQLSDQPPHFSRLIPAHRKRQA